MELERSAQRLFSRAVTKIGGTLARLSIAWEYRLESRTALPDGTRVRLVCRDTCRFRDHDGVWSTAWTPRRLNIKEGPYDYLLTREGDGETTYAHRSALEVLKNDR